MRKVNLVDKKDNQVQGGLAESTTLRSFVSEEVMGSFNSNGSINKRSYVMNASSLGFWVLANGAYESGDVLTVNAYKEYNGNSFFIETVDITLPAVAGGEAGSVDINFVGEAAEFDYITIVGNITTSEGATVILKKAVLLG